VEPQSSHRELPPTGGDRGPLPAGSPPLPTHEDNLLGQCLGVAYILLHDLLVVVVGLFCVPLVHERLVAVPILLHVLLVIIGTLLRMRVLLEIVVRGGWRGNSSLYVDVARTT